MQTDGQADMMKLIVTYRSLLMRIEQLVWYRLRGCTELGVNIAKNKDSVSVLALHLTERCIISVSSLSGFSVKSFSFRITLNVYAVAYYMHL